MIFGEREFRGTLFVIFGEQKKSDFRGTKCDIRGTVIFEEQNVIFEEQKVIFGEQKKLKF